MGSKRRLNTTLSRDAFKILEKHSREDENLNTIIERALESYDRGRYKTKIGLEKFDAVIERVKTGIPGFDALIEGGMPEGFIVTLTGPIGTGKTTFAMQFLMEGVKNGERAVYFSVEESAEQLAKHCLRFGWDLQKYFDEGLMEIYSLTNLDFEEVAKIISSFQPSRVAIDSLSLCYSDKELRNSGAWRSLVRGIKEQDIVCLLITEKEHGLEKKRYDSFDFAADGVVFLDKFVDRNINEFVLMVKKMRATKIDDTHKIFNFTDKGIDVTEASPFEL